MHLKNRLLKILTLLVIFIAWWGASLLINAEIILPNPVQVFSRVFELIKENDFLTILLFSWGRCLVSFLIALVVAGLLVILAFRVKILRHFLQILLAFLKSTPIMALILLFLIWSRAYTPILAGLFVAIPVIYQHIYLGIEQIDYKLIEMAQVYKLSQKTIWTRIYWPALKPFLVAAVTSGLGMNFKAIIAAEVLSQPEYGIGTAMNNASIYLETKTVFAWVIIIVFTVIITDYALDKVNKSLNYWRVNHVKNKQSF